MTLARAGSMLLVAAGVAVVIAMARVSMREPVGIGLEGPGGVLVDALFTLLGLGSAALALANSSSILRTGAVRASLGVFSVGALMEAAAGIGSTTILTGGLGSLPFLVLMLGGAAGMLLGVAALAISVPVARRRSGKLIGIKRPPRSSDRPRSTPRASS
jgi:hypothetical protein